MISRLLLTLTIATASLSAAADSGFLYTAGGTLSRVDSRGTTVLFECRREAQLVEVSQTLEPCRLNALTVHATGRYALTVDAPVNFMEGADGGLEAFSLTNAIELAGQRHVPPRSKQGRPLDGAWLVIGQPRAGAAPLVLEGLRDTWRSDARYYPQAPLAFAGDGEGLLVTEYVGSERLRLWSLDLRGTPRWRLELGGTIYQRITLADGAKAIELHTGNGTVAFLELPATVSKPLSKPAPRAIPGSITVAKVADTVVSFRPGTCSARDGNPERFGAFLRTNPSGQSREWRRSTGGCGTGDTVLAVSEPRRSVFVEERTPERGLLVLEYFIDDDRMKEHPFVPKVMLAVSPDGRSVGRLANGGLEVHGLDEDQVWWRTELPADLPSDSVTMAFTSFAD